MTTAADPIRAPLPSATPPTVQKRPPVDVFREKQVQRISARSHFLLNCFMRAYLHTFCRSVTVSPFRNIFLYAPLIDILGLDSSGCGRGCFGLAAAGLSRPSKAASPLKIAALLRNIRRSHDDFHFHLLFLLLLWGIEPLAPYFRYSLSDSRKQLPNEPTTR